MWYVIAPHEFNKYFNTLDQRNIIKIILNGKDFLSCIHLNIDIKYLAVRCPAGFAPPIFLTDIVIFTNKGITERRCSRWSRLCPVFKRSNDSSDWSSHHLRVQRVQCQSLQMQQVCTSVHWWNSANSLSMLLWRHRFYIRISYLYFPYEQESVYSLLFLPQK